MRHIWSEKADGIYLFNFLVTHERSTEPAFEVLGVTVTPVHLTIEASGLLSTVRMPAFQLAS